MPRNRHVTRCLLAMLAASVPGLVIAAQTNPHALLQVMRAASGGDQWSRTGEIDCAGTLHQGGLSAPRRMRADLANRRYTITTDVGIQRGTRGFDGPRAKRQAATRSYIARRGWFDPTAAVHADMRYLGSIDKHGQTLQRIEVQHVGGNAFELWIDPDTHLLAEILARRSRRTRTWRQRRGTRWRPGPRHRSGRIESPSEKHGGQRPGHHRAARRSA